MTMTLPPPPPPPKQSLPLLPNYYRTLKPTSVTLKLKGREVEGGVGWGLGFVSVAVRSCTEDFRLFLKAKTLLLNFFYFLCERMHLARVRQTWRVDAGALYADWWMGGVWDG